MTTLLIPEMNLTCNASIVGFTVAGRDLRDEPHSQVQIWLKNSSPSSSIYYQVGKFNVSLHDGVCVSAGAIADHDNIDWCILHDNFRVSVQPGDILGLVLPATVNDGILFTSGGPINYIFKHPNQLDSNIDLSRNQSSTAQQLPQIMFSHTSGREYYMSSCSILFGHAYECIGKYAPSLTFSSLLKWVSR